MEEMYFIIKGNVELVIIKNFKSIPYVTIEENYYFGEVDFIFSTAKTHMDTAKAQTKCDLLCLKYSDFENMCATFQETALEIMEQAKDRNEVQLSAKRKAEHEYLTERNKNRKVTVPAKLSEK